MSSTDTVFLAVDEPVAQVAEWIAELLGLERFPDQSSEADELHLRSRNATADGWFWVAVQRNRHVVPDADPDEIQAMDAYGIEIDMKYWPKTEGALHREARRVFEQLVKARPDIPQLLCEELAILIAAHLPGTGTHLFEPGTTPDAEDQNMWRPWVTS